MSKQRISLSASEQKTLNVLGANIRQARLRRKLSSETVAVKASVSRPTVNAIESGRAGVAIGNLIQVLCVLGLEKDLKEVACDEALKMKQREEGVVIRTRAPRIRRTP